MQNYGDGARVLIVDDELAIVNYLGALLSRSGYDVTTECDPLIAREKIRLEPGSYDLLITDQTMPNLSGTQLAEDVLKFIPGLPVVAITGYNTKLDDSAVRKAGIRALLNKPINESELLATIAKLIK